MGFSSMCYGYSASIIATTLAQPSFNTYFDLAGPSGTNLIATMNGVFQAGGFIGVITLAYFSDRWGRKVGIAVSAGFTLFSAALMAGSVNVGMFIVFRFFSGAGAFMSLSAAPTWMSEVAPPANRGLLVDLHGVALLTGYVIAMWTGYGFFYWDNINAWRIPMGQLTLL